MFSHHLQYFEIFLICVKPAHFNEICLQYTEKNTSEFFPFFIGILPQGVENRKICYLKGSIYYCESEITG